MRLLLAENTGMALDALRQNKMRSLLTVLGVVIGVTTLILVASILVGLDRDIRSFLNDFGEDTLWVFKINPSFGNGGLTAEERARKSLTFDDAMAIKDQCPAVKLVTVDVFPRVNSRQPIISNARYKGKEVSGVQYSGSLPESEYVYNFRVAKGRFFNEAETLHRSDVAVIGWDLASALFQESDPLGKEILVDSVNYTVIGVMEKHKGQFFRDPSADKNVQVPYRSYLRHHPNNDEYFIGALAYNGMKAQAEDEVRGLLRQRRRVAYKDPDNFDISSAESVARQFRQITGMAAVLIGVVSSIGLLVGGVGVMNIMLICGDPTNPRDWRAQSDWRAAPRCGVAVFDRGDDADRSWRRDRCPAGRCPQLCAKRGIPVGGSAVGGVPRRICFNARWTLFRSVSGCESGPARSGRFLALRIAGLSERLVKIALN
jgi:putative ABC transport system permease protein